MRRVALTGGIATGKSTVLQRFQRHGIPTIDADRLAREVVKPGEPPYRAIRNRFGDAVFAPDGALDRQALGEIVFADPDARAALEAIVHPAVYDAIDRWFRSLGDGVGAAVADIPLLYETGRAGDFDLVIVAACDPALQIRRVMARDGLSKEEAARRLAAQWPIEEKVRRADHVIRTDGPLEETRRAVDELVKQLRAG
jgi:dephospho-CoA kinase